MASIQSLLCNSRKRITVVDQTLPNPVSSLGSGQQFHCCSTVRCFPAIEPVSEKPRNDDVPNRLLVLDQKDSR
jgi:hypothetical protein